jgi:hypothetical protein
MRPSAIALLLAGCAGPTPPVARAVAPPPGPATMTDPLPGEDGGAPDAATRGEAAAPDLAGPVTATPPLHVRPTTFCPVASGDVTLFPLAHDGLLMAADRPLAVCDATGVCAPLPQSVLDALGPQMGDSVTAAAGEWGRDMWLTSFRLHIEGSLGWTVHDAGHGWRHEDRVAAGWRHVHTQLRASSDGAVAGIASFEIDGLHATPAQAEAGPPGMAMLEQLSGPRVGLPRLQPHDLPAALLLRARGQAVVAVDRVTSGEGHTLVLRTGRADPIPVPAPAPGCDEDTDRVLLEGLDAGPVFVAGNRRCAGPWRPYLARIDATSATPIDVPAGVGAFGALALLHDGTAWLTADGSLVVRAPDGAWSQAPLPAGSDGAPCLAASVVARTDADLFVLARCGAQSRVFRTQCPCTELPPAPPAAARSRPPVTAQ